MTSLVAQRVKNLTANAEDLGSIPGSGRSPEVGNGNPRFSSILAWRTPRTEESVGLQSVGSQRVGPHWPGERTPFSTGKRSHSSQLFGIVCKGKIKRRKCTYARVEANPVALQLKRTQLCESAVWPLSSRSVVSDAATPRAAARQCSPSMGFRRQEDWSGSPFPAPGDLPDPGTEPVSPAFAGRFSTTEPPGKALLSRYSALLFVLDVDHFLTLYCIWYNIASVFSFGFLPIRRGGSWLPD